MYCVFGETAIRIFAIIKYMIIHQIIVGHMLGDGHMANKNEKKDLLTIFKPLNISVGCRSYKLRLNQR